MMTEKSKAECEFPNAEVLHKKYFIKRHRLQVFKYHLLPDYQDPEV